MRVIGKQRLREFWKKHGRAESPLQAWRRVVEECVWEKFADVRATYASADKVGRCTVFDVGGNKYRVITRVSYEDSRVFIQHVLTHAEYDKEKWKGGC